MYTKEYLNAYAIMNEYKDNVKNLGLEDRSKSGYKTHPVMQLLEKDEKYNSLSPQMKEALERYLIDVYEVSAGNFVSTPKREELIFKYRGLTPDFEEYVADELKYEKTPAEPGDNE